MHENKFICFVSYDDEHHRVAFIDPGPLAEKAPSEGKTARAGGEVGLHHMAFTYAGLDDLIDNYLRLKELGIRPHRCVNHGVTTSMYYYDPDRNQVELLVDNFATATEGQAYMRAAFGDRQKPGRHRFRPRGNGRARPRRSAHRGAGKHQRLRRIRALLRSQDGRGDRIAADAYRCL